ncbi:roadblock/LC7 domain-containing protein [Streptomyces lavendulae]|uniref:hypothetical protein n=1 Tax=Streptomyces lavendulae TaxID=1914 RepID=UPI0036EB597C
MTYEEEIGQLEGSVRRLRQDANAKAVLLFDRDGQPVVEAGDTGSVDTTPPAVLTGGSGDGGADLIDKREQSVLIHEGQGDTVHLAIVAQWAVLVVLNSKIVNVATGYALDSGGETNGSKAPAYSSRDTADPAGNRRWATTRLFEDSEESVPL